jgi:hypothetical protein
MKEKKERGDIIKEPLERFKELKGADREQVLTDALNEIRYVGSGGSLVHN